MDWLLITYILTLLFPINGIILLGMIRERRKKQILLQVIWRWKNRVR